MSDYTSVVNVARFVSETIMDVHEDRRMHAAHVWAECMYELLLSLDMPGNDRTHILAVRGSYPPGPSLNAPTQSHFRRAAHNLAILKTGSVFFCGAHAYGAARALIDVGVDPDQIRALAVLHFT